jgi:hypothetical protein
MFSKSPTGDNRASAPPKPGGKLEAQQRLGRRFMSSEDRLEDAPVAKASIRPKVKIAGVKPASELSPVVTPKSRPGPKPKRGTLKDAKPWEAMGISRSLYFRRKASGPS